MKTLLIILSLFFTSVSVHAATKKTGYLIKSNFTLTASGKQMKSQSEFIMSEDNKTWTSLVEAKNGVALLGRIVKTEKDAIHMEYIIVDTTRPNVVISTPSIIARLGEQAEISVGGNTDEVKVSLLAKKTEYTQTK